jgi:hypothetical protein
MKILTRRQLESRKDKAARFARDVLGDEDRAAEIDDESLESYAERRHFQIRNPKGVKPVAVPTRRELFDRIKELESENEDLQTQIDEIADIVTPSEEEEQEGE